LETYRHLLHWKGNLTVMAEKTNSRMYGNGRVFQGSQGSADIGEGESNQDFSPIHSCYLQATLLKVAKPASERYHWPYSVKRKSQCTGVERDLPPRSALYLRQMPQLQLLRLPGSPGFSHNRFPMERGKAYNHSWPGTGPGE